MNPLRKYIPRQVPPAKLHPVDVMLNVMLVLCVLGIAICVLLILTKT